MVARKKGCFILLSSMQGKHGTKDASSFSKWGILGLMKSAAIELGEHNITVNALVDTALTRYEKRLSETMGGRSNIRRRSRPGTTARRPCRSRWAGCSRTTSRLPRYS
jgi:NAD(P)-dependent dehydrogenase (short-subunit alcohol dehydrogenase family)